jgi:hypothetical protein
LIRQIRSQPGIVIDVLLTGVPILSRRGREALCISGSCTGLPLAVAPANPAEGHLLSTFNKLCQFYSTAYFVAEITITFKPDRNPFNTKLETNYFFGDGLGQSECGTSRPFEYFF